MQDREILESEEIGYPFELIRRRLDSEHVISREVGENGLYRLEWELYGIRAALLYEEEFVLTTLHIWLKRSLPTGSLAFYATVILAMNNLFVLASCRITLGIAEEKKRSFLQFTLEREGWPDEVFPAEDFASQFADLSATIFFCRSFFRRPSGASINPRN